MQDKIVIIGGGGHAKVIISIIKKLDKYKIIGYTDTIDKGLILGVKYLGTDEVLKNIIRKYKNCKAVIGIGNIMISNKRQIIYKMLKEIGFNLPVIISKNAIVNEEVLIGEGTVVFDGAIINVNTNIGKCVIVNTNAIIEHNCCVGDFVHLTPLILINYGTNIGSNSFIGSGAIVKQNLEISKDCQIGAGSIVITNIIKKGTYFGIPAKLKLASR